MATKSFVHFRVQSSYSMLESALTIDNIVGLAKTASMPALCLADRGNLFGSLEFAISASNYGLQPIHGAILNLAIAEKQFAEILLIAKDDIGYHNLLKLVSYSFIKNERKICNHITLNDLVEYSDGIIALSCYTEGVIGKSLLSNDLNQAISWASQLQNIFGDRFYFEVMRHHLEKERLIEANYINIAADLGIPLLATNNVLFSNIEMHDAHDVLLCIAGGVTKDHDHRKRVSNQCYFKSKAEMIALFADLPSAIENTVCLAKRCYFMAETRSPMLPSFSTNKEIAEVDILRQEAIAGLNSRLAIKSRYENPADEISQVYFERLEYELDIICRMNFAGYFLIVADFIKWSKEQGIAVGPGRGSGVGSIVAWSLLITDLDPIKFGLLFERFLNPERISMPDFDIDFCQERREEVINYVRTKYGDNRVGQIITFGKMQAKAVIKDVARVLGLAYRYADYLTELVPFNAVNPVTLEAAIASVAELKAAASGNGLYNLPGEEEAIKQVLSTALVLEGLHRHTSVHAAGVVIAGIDLIELVPLYQDLNSNMLIVQYSMKYADLAGLMKFDFLGLQTLTVIAKCLELLRTRGTQIDLDHIPFDDHKTYQMLSTGAGTGVFQFESIGMKDTLKRLQPDCIGDLIALGSLYRPGPMENIPTYIACKHGKQQPDYLHPLLKPILEYTYGVIIYQEQVLEIAKTLAGYSLGAADLLRKAMGKKVKKEMQAQEEIFINGARTKGITIEHAKSIFATVAKFAGYGFNKAHASAYAVISYQTAYLKANFTLEFLVTCLNLELDNFDKINLFIQEAKNNQIKVIPPDINIARGYFSISAEKAIIYALGAIKNVPPAFGEMLSNERAKNGAFKNIIDFVERIEPKSLNRRLLENLIKAGCFDLMHLNRNQLLSSISKLMGYAVSYHQEKVANQFSLLRADHSNSYILQETAMLTASALSFQEFEVLGLFTRHHPLSEYYDILQQNGIYNSDTLHSLAQGVSQIQIAGVLQKKDSRMSARGRFISLQLSDQFSIFDVTIYNEEVIKNNIQLLELQTLVVVSCDAFKDDGGIKLTAKHFVALNDLVSNTKLNLKLYSRNYSELSKIVDILRIVDNAEQTNAEICLLLQVNECFMAKVELPGNFYLNNDNLLALKQFESNKPNHPEV
ncbi:DNA polymerase III subunit alpha [Candidatus Trichorickettsia mobilis]|uniref:DNA polymerase III subunit alpha n=1 Tax=Candidatus Trichorickettsia mobilis TaxID=1346319 RepID=UPI00292CEE34|nr:DNA polymerase III subunit alpha [Candidatus Trichorickettsia mobilis]